MKKNIIVLLLTTVVFCCTAKESLPVIETVFVQGGTYNWKKLLGIGSEEVTVSDLYVQKYETTRSEWEAFINETGKKEFYKITAVQLNYYNLMAYPESAAVGMTFYEALEYCNWRSKKEGYTPVYTLKGDMPVQSSYTYPEPVKMPEIVVNKKADGYRLPEESEWIYFALGGLEGIKTKWWEKRPVERYAWVATNSSSTEPVGKLEPNPVGLYDVFGNAWEWCWDIKPNSAGEEGINKSRLSCGACVSYTKSQNVGKDVLLFMAVLAKKGGSDPLERYYTGVRMVRNAAGISESAQGLFGSRYSAGKRVYAADNLNIRADPNVRGEKVVLAGKGSPLTVLEEGKKETIDGITAPWIKVRLPDGKEGWCFAGYVAARKP